MKLKSIVTATASAVALLAAGQAAAVNVEPWQITGAETYTLLLGGATAQDKGIVLLMRRLCAAGTMTQVAGNKTNVFFCDANGVDSLPIAAGTRLVLYKNSSSGSSSGVNPVANSTTIPFINLASLTQAQYTDGVTCPISNIAATPDFADVKVYNCGNNVGVVNSVPNGGLSDVEPPLLGYVKTTAPTNNELLSQAGPQVVFGVPVSLNFYRALQAAQGKALDDTEANMPSLTKAQITGIWTGGIPSPIFFSDITGTKLAAASFERCRRKNGSGTLASTRAYFTAEGCSIYPTKLMSPGNDGDATAPALPAGVVAEYGGTTGVLGCLNASNAGGKYGIGMASMETVPGSAYTSDAVWGTDAGNWRYIKVSGYAPTLLNVAQSKYDFVMEASWNYRGGANTTSGGPLAGDAKTFFDKMVATNSTQLVIKELNTQFIHSFGQSGLMGKPGTPTAPSAAPAGVLTAAEVTANPISTWTRAVAGTPNSCNPISVTKETGLDMLQ